jgi:hypothetical protein
MKVTLVDASMLHVLFPGIRWFEPEELSVDPAYGPQCLGCDEPGMTHGVALDARAVLGPIPKLRKGGESSRPVAQESRRESAKVLDPTRKTLVQR